MIQRHDLLPAAAAGAAAGAAIMGIPMGILCGFNQRTGGNGVSPEGWGDGKLRVDRRTGIPSMPSLFRKSLCRSDTSNSVIEQISSATLVTRSLGGAASAAESCFSGEKIEKPEMFSNAGPSPDRGSGDAKASITDGMSSIASTGLGQSGFPPRLGVGGSEKRISAPNA